MKKFYEQERRKVKDYLEYLESDEAGRRAKISINQVKRLRHRGARLNNLIKSLKEHIKKLDEKIRKIDSEKRLQEYSMSHVDAKSLLHNSIAELKKELEILNQVKKDLIQKEYDLVKTTKQLIKENREDLKTLDKKDLEKLRKLKVLQKDKIADQESLIDEEMNLFLKETEIFEKLDRLGKERLFSLNKELNDLKDIKISLIRKMQLAKEDRGEILEELRIAELKKRELEKKFNKTVAIYGGADPKGIKKEITKYLEEL